MPHFRTLLINSIFGAARAIGAGRETQENEVGYDVHSVGELKRLLTALASDKTTFDAAVFSTHGNEGRIFFDGESLSPYKLYKDFFPDRAALSGLFPKSNARILFAGCNVGEGDESWKFLLAAARTFLGNGGETIGWTSVGFAVPFGLRDGHVVHLWGDTRQVRNMGGHSFRFYENWKLIERNGLPRPPAAVSNAFA